MRISSNHHHSPDFFQPKSLRPQVLQASRRPLSESRIFSVASDASGFPHQLAAQKKRQLDTYGYGSRPSGQWMFIHMVFLIGHRSWPIPIFLATGKNRKIKSKILYCLCWSGQMTLLSFGGLLSWLRMASQGKIITSTKGTTANISPSWQ